MFVVRDPLVGHQSIHATSLTQEHPLGTIVKAHDPLFGAGEFVYLIGVASTLEGSWVTYNADDGTTARLAADARAPVAIAMSANVANQYGWYQIDGKAVGKALANYADNGLVYATSTAGSVDDAPVAGDRVKLAKGASAQGSITASSGNVVTAAAEFEIHRPFMDDAAAA